MISVSGVSMRYGSKVLFEDVTTTFSASYNNKGGNGLDSYEGRIIPGPSIDQADQPPSKRLAAASCIQRPRGSATVVAGLNSLAPTICDSRARQAASTIVPHMHPGMYQTKSTNE